MEATLELCVAVVTALDEDLARREQSDGAEATQAAGRARSDREEEAPQDAERDQSDRAKTTQGTKHDRTEEDPAP
jgi:hypothetical protein